MSRKKREVYDIDEAKIAENVQKKWPDDVQGYYYTFATTLNRLLMEKQIDQRQMVRETGIAAGTISGYRNGIGNPTLDKLRIIAAYLGVDCNYLMTGVRSDHHEISTYTGLSEQSIQQLHYYKDHSDKEKRCGWLSIESKVLQALNTLLERNFSILLYIADYLHFRKYSDFSMIPDPGIYHDLPNEEFKDTGIDINGEYEFENQTVPASVFFHVSEAPDLLLLKVQTNLIELRQSLLKEGK